MYIVFVKSGPEWDGQRIYYTKNAEMFSFLSSKYMLDEHPKLEDLPAELRELVYDAFEEPDKFYFNEFMEYMESVTPSFPLQVDGVCELYLGYQF